MRLPTDIHYYNDLRRLFAQASRPEGSAAYLPSLATNTSSAIPVANSFTTISPKPCSTVALDLLHPRRSFTIVLFLTCVSDCRHSTATNNFCWQVNDAWLPLSRMRISSLLKPMTLSFRAVAITVLCAFAARPALLAIKDSCSPWSRRWFGEVGWVGQVGQVGEVGEVGWVAWVGWVGEVGWVG